jgi:predicted acylesterase/phospholipase RssA
MGTEYKEPELQCDLVMRGGITSGIVYPRAIAKLAETYKFRSIGGTSAGAIAATGTAAAAYGARQGKNHFQTRFKNLPSELGEQKKGKTVLERLFQPEPSTRRLFRLLMSGLGRENKVRKIARIVATLCKQYWPLALLGAAIAFVPLLAFAKTSVLGGLLFWFLLVLGLVPAAAFVVLMAAGGALRDILRRLPQNRYGMCSGSSNGVPDEAGVLPLTDWLHEFFQSVANRQPDDPVTFGDLWNKERDGNAERDIDLVLITTNVTRGISQAIPDLEGNWGPLFFKKQDFDKLFPASVVKWMTEHAGDVARADDFEIPHGTYRIPKAADLPILLGARMSLSFPFLLSAVPLYAPDFANPLPNGKFPLELCWFSDGGLTSNFPVHLFDSPLPTRPTFGINLVPENVHLKETEDNERPLPDAKPIHTTDAWKKIWMPRLNGAGFGSARFNKFERKGGNVVGFFSAMFDTARNWGDTELMAMQGYRDRIVHVRLAENEGGLNLSMPKSIITSVGERGECAGALLAARFAPTPQGDEDLIDPLTGERAQLTWDNHRWVRYRAIMAAFEELARRFRSTWRDVEKQKPWRTYYELLRRGPDSSPTSYPFGTVEQGAFAADATEKLVDFVESWKSTDQTFDRAKGGSSPQPKPVLRLRPF